MVESPQEPRTALPDPPLAARHWLTWAGLALLLVGVALASLVFGSTPFSLRDIWDALIQRPGADPSARTIIMDYRLPTSLGAMLAGAALAISGLLMQTLFMNPLAGPFVLGIDAGASLGVAAAVLVGGSATSTAWQAVGTAAELGRVVAGCLGAAGVMVIVLAASRRVRDAATLLILGLMIGYATNALVSVLLHFSGAAQVESYIAWTFGSFRGITWDRLRPMSATLAVGLLLSATQIKPLNALLLGDFYARSMGVRTSLARVGIVLAASILAGGVTAFCGPIAFLGVAAPHLARGLFATSDHRILLVGAALVGAALALTADFISRWSVAGTVLPLNAVTALIGAPVVAYIVLARRDLLS